MSLRLPPQSKLVQLVMGDSARLATALAGTYNPNPLRRIGVVG